VANQLHKIKALLRNSFRLVVQAGAADSQQLALACYWERRVTVVDQLTPLLQA